MVMVVVLGEVVDGDDAGGSRDGVDVAAAAAILGSVVGELRTVVVDEGLLAVFEQGEAAVAEVLPFKRRSGGEKEEQGGGHFSNSMLALRTLSSSTVTPSPGPVGTRRAPSSRRKGSVRKEPLRNWRPLRAAGYLSAYAP